MSAPAGAVPMQAARGGSLMNDTSVMMKSALQAGLPSVGTSSCHAMSLSAAGSSVAYGVPPERSAKWTTDVPVVIGPYDGEMQLVAVQVPTAPFATALSSLGTPRKLSLQVPRSPDTVNRKPV